MIFSSSLFTSISYPSYSHRRDLVLQRYLRIFVSDCMFLLLKFKRHLSLSSLSLLLPSLIGFTSRSENVIPAVWERTLNCGSFCLCLLFYFLFFFILHLWSLFISCLFSSLVSLMFSLLLSFSHFTHDHLSCSLRYERRAANEIPSLSPSIPFRL